MKSHILGFFVVMALVLSLAVPALAQGGTEPAKSGTCGDNLTWELDDDGVLTISGTGEMDDYNTNYGVGLKPWSRSGVITKVVLNDGITSIGGGAFYNLYQDVTEITIPASVKSIGRSAFSGANGVTTIRFEHAEDDPLTMDEYAFYYYYGRTYNMTEHPLLDTTVIVRDKDHINPALSGYAWQDDLRNVTFISELKS